jgi:uncharacterized protein YjbI with pentapeptide repeats
MRLLKIAFSTAIFLILIYVGCSNKKENHSIGKSEKNVSNTSKPGKIIQIKSNSGNSVESIQSTNTGDLTKEKLKAEIIKLQEEAKKLKIEIFKIKEESDVLKSKNEAPDRNIRWLTVWFTAIGSILIAIFGFFINRTIKRTQRKKIEQDKRLGREKHMLEVFRELGADDPRIRIGAAAILIQRLEGMREKINKKRNMTLIQRIKRFFRKKDEEAIHEFQTIMNVLLAVTKHEEKVEIQKYIADGIALALDAIVPDDDKRPKKSESPLKQYDFQGTKLCDAYWRRIDAREIDFFKASLIQTGLREAYLYKAVFMEADLTMAILKAADLESANLQNANLKGTSLAKANLRGANLSRANLVKSDLSKAKLMKADLSNVDLCTAIIDGADFRGAKFNKGTKLKREQLDKAKFSRKVEKIVTIVD